MSPRTIALALACSVIILSGCGLYSKYERPALEIDAEQLYRSDSTVIPLSSLAWHELFKDPILNRWISSALTANTDLRIARLRTEEAAATLTASKLAILPSLDIKAQGSASRSVNEVSIMPTAQWEADIFGRQRNTRLGAQAAFFEAEAYRQAVQTSLIATVADGYYTLLMLDEQLAISERTLTTWDENIRVLQALKRAGRTNEAAVLQARANRMRVENSALTLRSRITAQENSIRSILFDPTMDLTRGSLKEQIFPDTLSAGLPLELLSNRPDVREAEFNLQQKFYRINVARGAFYPSLTLSGSAGWTERSGNIGNPSSWIANALGAITAPIFNRGTNRANLAIAKAQYEEALLNFQQKLVDAGSEVNDALTQWQTARERLDTDRKQIVALKGAVHNTRLLMRHTNTNYLEVLTAQQRLLEAELTEASDRYEAIQSVIALYHALGGGSE